jgi:hypothetical protein
MARADHRGRIAHLSWPVSRAGAIRRPPIPWHADQADFDLVKARVPRGHMWQSHEGRHARKARKIEARDGMEKIFTHEAERDPMPARDQALRMGGGSQAFYGFVVRRGDRRRNSAALQGCTRIRSDKAMTDLDAVLKISARTGRFHGRTAQDEQTYFEVFANCRSMSEQRARVSGCLKWLSAALGRRPLRRARLS